MSLRCGLNVDDCICKRLSVAPSSRPCGILQEAFCVLFKDRVIYLSTLNTPSTPRATTTPHHIYFKKKISSFFRFTKKKTPQNESRWEVPFKTSAKFPKPACKKKKACFFPMDESYSNPSLHMPESKISISAQSTLKTCSPRSFKSHSEA